jgi:hypothetical protein
VWDETNDNFNIKSLILNGESYENMEGVKSSDIYRFSGSSYKLHGYNDDGTIDGGESLGDDEELLIYVDEENNKIYQVVEKYEYKNAQYYINGIFMDVAYQRASLGFEDGYPNSPNDNVQSGGIYVMGKFENGSYKFYKTAASEEDDGIYESNLLEYKDENYSINGIKIKPEDAEHNETYFNYKMSTLTKQQLEEDGKYYGYDFFDKVYYTTQGNANLGLTKYATFAGGYNNVANISITLAN